MPIKDTREFRAQTRADLQQIRRQLAEMAATMDYVDHDAGRAMNAARDALHEAWRILQQLPYDWANHPRYDGLITQEFPRFDLRDLPANLPSHWIDQSWHNDTCPIFEVPDLAHGALRVSIDYLNVEDRESAEGLRFSAWLMDEDEREVSQFNSDSFIEILSWTHRQWMATNHPE